MIKKTVNVLRSLQEVVGLDIIKNSDQSSIDKMKQKSSLKESSVRNSAAWKESESLHQNTKNPEKLLENDVTLRLYFIIYFVHTTLFNSYHVNDDLFCL